MAIDREQADYVNFASADRACWLTLDDFCVAGYSRRLRDSAQREATSTQIEIAAPSAGLTPRDVGGCFILLAMICVRCVKRNAQEALD